MMRINREKYTIGECSMQKSEISEQTRNELYGRRGNSLRVTNIEAMSNRFE